MGTWTTRLILAVLLLAVALLPSAAAAQQRGQAEAMGLGGHYRPAAWVPVRVGIVPGELESGTYQIRILQRDLDGQRVYWSRNVPLTSGNATQVFEAYFKPDPARGLPSGSRAEFVERVQLSLWTPEGEEVMPLAFPENEVPTNVELGRGRDVKVVLSVGERLPMADDYAEPGLVGVKEDVLFLQVAPEALPLSVIGYDMADAVLWGDVPPDALSGPQRTALEDYVAEGGHLVLMQRPVEWQTMLNWGGLLPVTFEPGDALGRRPGSGPMASLAMPPAETTQPRPFDDLRGEYAVGVVDARPGTITEYWHRVPGVADPVRPWLVRQPVGAGAVSYVAEDLSDPTLTRLTPVGWAGVWTEVFGWGDEPTLMPRESLARQERVRATWASTQTRDAGFALNGPMRLPGATFTLVGVAIVFLAVYWLVAGPGLYLWLASRRRSGLSWFAFAAAAVVATALTLGIVNLVLGGSATANFAALFRHDSGGRALSEARVGLYVPRDGLQQIEAHAVDPQRPSNVLPFSDHPARSDDSLSPIPGSYAVVVRTGNEPNLGEADIPYRSTLKKVEADWRGAAGATAGGDADLPPVAGGILGSAELRPLDPDRTDRTQVVNLRGRLTNNTGVDLEDVYVAFRAPFGGRWRDFLLHVPAWRAGTTRDLALDVNGGGQSDKPRRAEEPRENQQAGRLGRDRVFGRVDQYDRQLNGPLRTGSLNVGQAVVPLERLDLAVPHLGLFARLPVMRNPPNATNRVELMRRNARSLDVSPALAAGSLVVLGRADSSPLPFPLTVGGDVLEAGGSTFYQAVLPLDTSAVADQVRPRLDAPPGRRDPADASPAEGAGDELGELERELRERGGTPN